MSQQLHGQIRLSRALDPTNSRPAARLCSRTDILELQQLAPPRTGNSEANPDILPENAVGL